MPKIHCVRSVPIIRTPRVKQLEGMFDVPPASQSAQSWDVDLPLEERDWRIGLIVGPSGCGKTTLARELFPGALIDEMAWPAEQSIVDAFPETLGIRDITGLLSSVGFSSPPGWLRPFRALSNGEQFRVTIARLLAERPDLAVVDEFTSVVDRTVARIGSAAIARTIRRSNRRLVAVSCHYDIINWLDPDWTYDPAAAEFHWRWLPGPTGRAASKNTEKQEAFSLSPTLLVSPSSPASDSNARRAQRPAIRLEIARVHRQAWRLFQQHHYLSGDLHKAAKCFVAFVVEGEGAAETGNAETGCRAEVSRTEYSVLSTQFSVRPAAFTAVLHAPDAQGGYWREHRTVCLPDFQGVGIGNALSEFIAGVFVATGKRYCSRTSHPAMIRHRAASSLWRMTRGARFGSTHTGSCRAFNRKAAVERMTAAFRFVGPPNIAAAHELGILAGCPDRAPGGKGAR